MAWEKRNKKEENGGESKEKREQVNERDKNLRNKTKGILLQGRENT